MKNLLLELVGLAGFANAILYIGGFFRKLENERQAEISAQNKRITMLEGQMDAVINSSYQHPSEEITTVKSFEELKDLFEGDYKLEEEL